MPARAAEKLLESGITAAFGNRAGADRGDRDQRIRPSIADNDYLPEEFDWLLTDGWWARVDDGAELHRYTDLFGSLAVVR